MTASTIELSVSQEDRRVASLAAAALGLTLLEAAIPSPIPGIKPGLANIVVLLVLLRYGWRLAAWVSLLRVVAAGLLLGSFMTPGFVLSLAGAIAALAMLGLARRLAAHALGPVGLSVLAAFAHVGTQLAVVDVWLMPGASLAALAPLFLAAAWVTGLVNGLAAAWLLQRLPAAEPDAAMALPGGRA
ncbi:MAG: Gx transporter family protein [Thiobacillaceae bacterium]|nr:Gx transporter family protein [Thiobacillaceae bacterium]